MTTQQAVEEAAIRQQIEKLVEAIRAMDLEGLKPIYARDLVSFDAGPPLGYEVRDLGITLDGDVAFTHSFNRVRGTMKNGNSVGSWVRVTLCFRKIDGNWLIAHDHISAPFDPATGKAVMGLAP